MKKTIGLVALAAFSLIVYAGGNPEFVPFPADYKETFTRYHSQNRANNKQVADMYANDIAVKSARNGKLADGSVVIMEVYAPVVDEEGKPVSDSNGMFRRDKLAAVAVMERRSEWSAEFPEEDRAGGWGFAIYDPSGNPKENDLECAACHTPLANQEFMFTYSKLASHPE